MMIKRIIILSLVMGHLTYLFCQSSIGINFKLSKSNISSVGINDPISSNKASGFEIGILKNQPMSSNFNWGIGLQYVRMGSTSYTLKNLIWPSEITGNGYVFDPKLPHQIRSDSYHNYIEMPLKIEARSNGSLYLSIAVTSSFQYYLNSMGRYSDDFGSSTTYATNAEVRRANIALEGSCSLNYRVSPKIAVYTSAFYKQQMLNLQTASFPSKYQTYGLGIGINYFL